MAKQYVPIFFDWLENTQDLSAEEKGHLIDAVIMYASGSDEWLDMLQTSGERIAFRFMRSQVDRNQEISDARSKAGSNKHYQNETNENKTEQTGTNENKRPKEKEEEKEKEKEKENKKEVKRFAPPTVDEVRAYCTERGNKVDPERFVDFYASKGWMVGNQKMKDWKAAVRTWEKGNDSRAAPVKKTPAQNYTQRSYGNEQQKLIEAFYSQEVG